MDTKTLDQQLAESLTNINKRLGAIDELQKQHGEHAKAVTEITKTLAEVQKDFAEYRRLTLEMRSVRRGASRPDMVSDSCAKHLGAIAIRAGITQGKLGNDEAIVQRWGTMADGILGKAALTTSDIPLPQEYASEVVELVAQYGTARRYGMVYPMGAGTVNLPKLKTSPAFGLIAASATVTEKSPQIEFVTLSAKKWGGLVRLPSEIDEDSVVAMGQFIARYSAREMAKIEDTVFWQADTTGTYASLSGVLYNYNAAATRVTAAGGSTSEATLANIRAMRPLVASAALAQGAYYFHPSMEALLVSFNNNTNGQVYVANAAGGPTLDGFKVRWVDVFPVYSAVDSLNTAFGAFGDATFSYLGVRGGMRFDTSKEAGFATDEILVRALERFTVGHLAADSLSIIRNAAA